LPWDKVLIFTFQQIQHNIETLFAKLRGIPQEAGKISEGKRLSEFTQL
jgi:hypothetical protein